MTPPDPRLRDMLLVGASVWGALIVFGFCVWLATR